MIERRLSGWAAAALGGGRRGDEGLRADVLGLEPQAYLTDVIARIVAGHPQSALDELLPWAYAPQSLKAVA